MICQFSEHARFQKCIWKIQGGGGGVKVLEKRRLGFRQLLGLTKTLTNATQTAPSRCSQPGPAQPGVARKEGSCRAAKRCRRRQGRRALRSQEDIKWNAKAEDTKPTSPGDREWTVPLPLPRCMPDSCFPWGDRVAVSLALYRGMLALPAECSSGCACGMRRNTEEHRGIWLEGPKPTSSVLINHLESVWPQHHLKQNRTYLRRHTGLPKSPRQSRKVGFQVPAEEQTMLEIK